MVVSPVTIGSQRLNLVYLNGSLDELAIWNRTLSATEIKAIYDRQKGAFTPRGQYESQIFDAGAQSNWTNMSWHTEVPYGLELPNNQVNETGNFVRGMNMSGNVLLYHFDNNSVENTTQTPIYDWSGNNNNASNGFEGLFNTSGKFGGSISFDGVGTDKVALLLTSSASVKNQNEVTISGWVHFSSYTHLRDLNFEAEPAGNSRFRLTLDADGSLTLGGRRLDADGFTNFATSNNGLLNGKVGKWTHITGVYNGVSGNHKVYMNGIDITDSSSGTTGAFQNTNPSAMYIGYAGINFNGSIDELAIWNRSLSAQEIKDIYLRGAVRLNLTVRSCDDSSCVGESFVDVANNTAKQTLLPTNASRYFQYRFGFITDDGDYSPQLYNVTIEVGNVTVYGVTSPLITNVTPRNGTTFNLSQIVIGANATDADIDVLYLIANITYPNATFQQFILTQQTNTNVYNISYTLPAAGAYTFTIISNDSSNGRTEQRGFFTVDLNFTKVINFTPQFVGYIGGVLNRTELNVTPGTFLQLNASDKLQELPDNQSTEYFLDRIVNMTGNVLLMHFNNDSAGGENQTNPKDWSGMGNNGTWNGGGQSNGTAKLGAQSGFFDGIDDWVNISDSNSINFGAGVN